MIPDELARLIERLPFASIDHLRPHTQGHQEVIFCTGKTPGQVTAIAERLAAASGEFLATRAERDTRRGGSCTSPRGALRPRRSE